MNEALRDWVTNVANTFYFIGTVAGPHPYPMMVRDFQCVIGDETREQMQELEGRAARLADRLHRRRLQRHGPVPSLPRRQGRRDLSASRRPGTASTAACMRPRSPAAGPACCTATARICCRTTTARSTRRIRSRPASTIPASGRSTPGCTTSGRVEFLSATDDEALAAFQLCCKLEGIIPALEPAHALARVIELAPQKPKDHLMVVNLSGRGDKDLDWSRTSRGKM